MKTQNSNGNLWVQETYVNRSLDSRFGESEVYESYTSDTGKLYRSLMREYGRCDSKMWIDDKNGKAHHIGWVFVKRARYADCSNTYLQETWVTVHKNPPTKTIEYHYAEL